MTAELVELTVEDIAAGGDGLARHASGRVVFVPRTAPGDRVIAELTESRTRWARGRVVEWKQRGPDRVDAPCSHYEDCGGCSIQHLSGDAQAAGLQRAVGDALQRIGGVETPVRPLIRSETPFGYRNRVTFTLRREHGRVTAGYHRLTGPRLVDVADCPLAERPVRDLWTALRSGWGKRAAALPAGREIRLTLRASVSGQTALLVDGGDAPGDPDRIMEAAPGLASYCWHSSLGERLVLGGEERFFDEWGGVPVPLRPEAFLQVNRGIAARIDEHIADELGPIEGLTMLDLYAGVGLRALTWARQGAHVSLVESNADAIETARELAADAAIDLTLLHGRVEGSLDAVLPADIVLVNPPRSGLSQQVTERLAQGGGIRLIYVSCNPATLARDVARLSPHWRVEVVQPFDAFPQTGHVETVAWLAPVSA